jgi:Na+/melibiose symporter-like transporter
MEASIPYVVLYILDMPASATTLIMAGFLLGAVCTAPLWTKLAKKWNNNGRVMLITAILMGVVIFPLTFLNNYFLIILNVILWGVVQGGYWTMIFAVYSDVIDESVVLYQKREEGTYIGLQQFFGRLGLILQVLSFAIIHTLTGFVEGSKTQNTLAIWGIHLHLSFVPMIFILIGAAVFWKLYDLKPDKVTEHHLKIQELKL